MILGISLTRTEPQLVLSEEIDTELTHPRLLQFPKFIRERMAFGQLPGIRMGSIESYASSGGHYMEFTAGPQRDEYSGTVRIYLERPMRVELRSSVGRDEAFEKQLLNVLLMTVQFFEEEVRASTLYLAFVPGSPKTAQLRIGSSALRKMFSGNLLSLFLLSMIIGIVIYYILYGIGFQNYAPVVLIIFMLVLVLSAGRISTLRSPWRIKQDARDVILVQLSIPEGMLAKYVGENKDRIKTVKEKIYSEFLGHPFDLSAETVSKMFVESGLPTNPEDILVRKIDVYGLVENAAKKYDMDVPAIMISSDPRPNAAATGFSKNLATMIITMGLLVQLDKEEIEVVIGHELSHLRSGDPLALFCLVLVEYTARVYVYGQYLGSWFILYFIMIFWLIFFFGRFLETRADLEAALIIGKPKVMSEALKKIGYRRLVIEERFLEPGGSRFSEWLRFDPHPPLYFRIQRLEQIDLKNPPKHPFIDSVRAVLKGFAQSRNVR